jgi:hypothetical protein
MLYSEHSLVQLSIVVLFNCLGRILRSLVHDSSRAQELTKLISVELALLQFSNLLK